MRQNHASVARCHNRARMVDRRLGRVGRTGPPEFGRSHDHLGELRVQGILRHDVPHLQEGGAARQGIQSDQGASLVDPKFIFLQARRMRACIEQRRDAWQKRLQKSCFHARLQDEGNMASQWQLRAWGRRGSVQEEPHLCHVAVVIQGAQVVEQLQRSHQGLWGRRVHEVKVHLHASTQPAVSGRSTSMQQILQGGAEMRSYSMGSCSVLKPEGFSTRNVFESSRSVPTSAAHVPRANQGVQEKAGMIPVLPLQGSQTRGRRMTESTD